MQGTATDSARHAHDAEVTEAEDDEVNMLCASKLHQVPVAVAAMQSHGSSVLLHLPDCCAHECTCVYYMQAVGTVGNRYHLSCLRVCMGPQEPAGDLKLEETHAKGNEVQVIFSVVM